MLVYVVVIAFENLLTTAISASTSARRGDANSGLDGASTSGVRVRRTGAGASHAETSSSLVYIHVAQTLNIVTTCAGLDFWDFINTNSCDDVM